LATSTVTLALVAPSFNILDAKHVAGITLRSNGSGAHGDGAYDIIGPTGSSLATRRARQRRATPWNFSASGLDQPIPPFPRARFLPEQLPQRSSATFCAQPPDLRFAPLMDTDFAVSCPLVRRWRLISGFCPSTRTFDPCFFQTPPRGVALASSLVCRFSKTYASSWQERRTSSIGEQPGRH
jgi:hypothetical protein